MYVEPVGLRDRLVGDLAADGVDALRERGVVGDRTDDALVGDRLDVRQRHVRQRLRRRDRNGARHVRDAVVDDAVDLEHRVVVGRRVRRLEASALVDRDIDEHRAGLHQAEHLARHEPWRERPGYEHGSDHHVGVDEDLLDLEAIRHRERDPPVEGDLEIAHPLDRLVEHPHVRLHAERDDRRVEADDASTEDDHLGRRHARDAAEQDAPAAVRLLERPGAHLRREPARDLAHRREQRQMARRRLDRLVRDAGDARVDERARQGLVRGDVQVREQRQVFAEPAVLLRDRLLHLEQELCRAPHLVDGRDARADRDVGVVGEARPDAGVLLDGDLVAALNELERACGRESDAILALLDLSGDSDPHRGRTIQERWLTPESPAAGQSRPLS